MTKDYELAFQDQKWYEKNKDNFEKSTGLKNLHFFQNDLTRFGELVEQDGWYFIKIKKGLRVYHSSRSLVLTHSDYPIAGYSSNLTPEQNRENILKNNEECLRKNPFKCIINTYYSSPPQNEYLHRDTDKNFLGPQIRYSFGIDTLFKDISPIQDSLINPKFNDRLSLEANEHQIGVATYVLNKDTLFLLISDDFIINRGGYGYKNVKRLYDDFSAIRKTTLDRETFSSAAGVYLRDNILFHMHTYPKNNNIEWFANSLLKLFKLLERVPIESPQGDRIGNVKYIIQEYKKNYNELSQYNMINFVKQIISSSNNDLGRLPGLRMSTFEADRIFHNYVYSKFSSKSDPMELSGENFNSKIGGIVGGNIFNIRFDPKIEISSGILVPTKVGGLFHPELVAFYAPDILKRDEKNKLDSNYYLGKILNEMRKYKTNNILTVNDQNFHEGHLYEHSNWVGLNSVDMYNKFSLLAPKRFNSTIFLIAGVLHDIGKSGYCGYENAQTFKNFNPHAIPKKYYCRQVEYIDSQVDMEIGFEYYDIPNHPEMGYKMLKGLIPYHLYTLKDNKLVNDSSWYSTDWNKIFTDSGVNKEEEKAIRIAVATHWNYGELINTFSENKHAAVEKYLRKIEQFYNAEFPWNKDMFLAIVYLVMIVSIADILGAVYRSLTNQDLYKIYNEIPNYSWFFTELEDALDVIKDDPKMYKSKMAIRDIINNPNKLFEYYAEDEQVRKIFNRLVNTSNMDKMAELSIEIAQKVANGKFPVKMGKLAVESFPTIWSYILKFEFNPNPYNNFNIMNTILYELLTLEDVLLAYSQDFPKVIIFDLDSTLFNLAEMWSSGTYHFFNDVSTIINYCQKLRKWGIKICIASRHYLPKRLIKELKDPSSPIFWKNFDLIISQFTGDYNDIKKYCNSLGDFDTIEKCLSYQEPCENKDYKNWCLPEFYNKTGFILANEGNERTVFYKPIFTTEKTKKPHINFASKYFNQPTKNMILFDDDEFYIKELDKEVYTAGVLAETGITFDIFNQAIRLYTFDHFSKN